MSEPSSSLRKTSVMLVEDHGLVRRGFRRMLEDDPEIAVIAEASDGHEAVDLARKLRPDVVVMDFALPSMNGAVATRQILRGLPETAVLMLSMHSMSLRACILPGCRRPRISAQERDGSGTR